MRLLFLLYNIFLVKSQLLTHKAIGEKIADIQGLFNQKQKEWLEKNKNNELVLIDYLKNYKSADIIGPIIKRYLAETKNTSVYVVSFKKLLDSRKYRYNTVSLAKHASDIIKECVKTNKPHKQEKYGLIWECWKITSDDDYENLKEQIDIADMLYIDGFCDGHDSYEEFISHYLYNGDLMCYLIYRIVINLQKTIENNTTYMDVIDMSKNLKHNDLYVRNIKIVKFLNGEGEAILNTIQPQDESKRFVIGKHYLFTSDIDNYFPAEPTDFFCNWCVPVIKYTQKIEHVQYKFEMSEDLNTIKQNKFKNIDLKIINYDAIKMLTQKNDYYEISFATFVREKKQKTKIVHANAKNKCEYISTNYEAVIMVEIFRFEIKYRHIITYPVSDANGEFPVKNYDPEDKYYKELISQHDKVQKMLDTIYNIYQNDCIIDDKNSLLLNQLLDLDGKCQRNYTKITDKIELVNTDIPYHQQNIEFIKKLQSKFGEKITIELYNLDSDKVSRNKIYSFSSYCDFNDLLSCKNEIDRITYLKTQHNNNDNDVIIMVLKIKNTTEHKSTYYLIHDKYTSEKDKERMEKHFQINKKNEAKLKTKTEKELRKKYKDPKKDSYNETIYEHLVSKIPDLMKHMIKEQDKFIYNNYYFHQKLLLHMFNEPTNLLKQDNFNTNQPSSNGSHLNNTNATNNQEKDKKKSDKQQNTPIFDFIVKNYTEFNEINEFANILLQPNIQRIQSKWSTYYSDLLVCMRKILINEMLVNNFIKINTSRKLYLQVKQITAPKDDYDTIKKYINEIFCKKKKLRHTVYMKGDRVKSKFL